MENPKRESAKLNSSSSEADVVTVDVHSTKDLIRSGHRYLDVRTVEEFNTGHPVKALNVPYMFMTPEGRVKNPEFIQQVSSICSKSDQIIVGCQSGARSLKASAELLNADFLNVKNMGGGYAEWVENGFDVNKGNIAHL